MNENLLLNLPFPYFHINKDMEILSTSIEHVEGLLPINITNLLASSSEQDFVSFIAEAPNKSSKLFAVKWTDKVVLQRIYKVENDQSTCHLFCFPIDSDAGEIYELIEHVEKKLLQVNLQLIEKKRFFEQAAKDIQEAASSYEYRNDVGKLAAGIAHEIRNPLTTVKGFIQLLKPYLIEIDKEQYANIALEEIDRANEIIYEFLNATKPQVNRQKEVHLNKLAHEMSLLYESEATLRNIKLTTKLSQENPLLFIDVNQLKQVLTNIIKNAFEAIGECGDKKGVIEISTDVTSHSGNIMITDNGCGMASETIEKLFMPFYSTKNTGTGIGLPICKKIVEAHGGEITVASSAGEGTKFTIKLPLYKTTETKKEAESQKV